MEELLKQQLLILLNNIFLDTPIEFLENEVFAYGVRNYMAKYSLQNSDYGVSETALEYINVHNLMNQNGSLLRRTKVNHEIKYEHVIPMKVLFDYLKAVKVSGTYTYELLNEMMNVANKVFILTNQENFSLNRINHNGEIYPFSLSKRMPIDHDNLETFWHNENQLYSRYISRNIQISHQLITMHGAIYR